MKSEEIEKAMRPTYGQVVSPNFNLEILLGCPEMIISNGNFDEYETPAEVESYFAGEPEEEVAYKFIDDFVYSRDKSYLRVKDITNEVRRILESNEMKKYLQQIFDGEKLRLKPLIDTFLNENGTIIAMQKDAYNAFSKNNYDIKLAVEGKLISQYNKAVRILGTPPTRWLYTAKMKNLLRGIKEQVRS